MGLSQSFDYLTAFFPPTVTTLAVRFLFVIVASARLKVSSSWSAEVEAPSCPVKTQELDFANPAVTCLLLSSLAETNS